MEDIDRGKLFINISDGKTKFRSAEHSGARKTLKELEEVHYFSKESNTENETRDTFPNNRELQRKNLGAPYMSQKCAIK